MFKGQFKFTNANGIPASYSNGDIVVHQGKVYKASNTTQNSPLQDKKSWTYLSLTEPYKGTNPPVNPKENQMWLSDSGTLYTYFYDGDSYQWVSV